MLNPDFRAPDIYDPTTFTEPYAYAAGNPMMFWDPNGLHFRTFEYINVDAEGKAFLTITEIEYQKAINGQAFSVNYIPVGKIMIAGKKEHDGIVGKTKEEIDLYLARELGREIFGERYRRAINLPDGKTKIDGSHFLDFIEDAGWNIVAKSRLDPFGIFDVAARNLETFLSGSANIEKDKNGNLRRVEYYDPEFVLNSDVALEVLVQNVHNAAFDLQKIGHGMVPGGTASFVITHKGWIKYPKGFYLDSFFWGAGSSGLTSRVEVNYWIEGEEIVAEGYVYNHWYDIYDWTPGVSSDGSTFDKSVRIPGIIFGSSEKVVRVFDSAWFALESSKNHLARSFEMESSWRQKIQIRISDKRVFTYISNEYEHGGKIGTTSLLHFPDSSIFLPGHMRSN